MELATIIGTVVATEKHHALEGVRLLLARPIDHAGTATDEYIVLADALQAGVGQRVEFVIGREACHSLPVEFTPVDAAVVAIVDGVDEDRGSP